METSILRGILDSKYNEYKNKYTDIMLNILLKEDSESNFSCIEEMVEENEYSFPKNPEQFYDSDWYYSMNFTEEEIKIEETDLEIYFLVRSSSKYLDYVLQTLDENYINPKEIYERIFLRECYINAILMYVTKYVSYFNLKDEFLQIYKDKFSNFETVCERFFYWSRY